MRSTKGLGAGSWGSSAGRSALRGAALLAVVSSLGALSIACGAEPGGPGDDDSMLPPREPLPEKEAPRATEAAPQAAPTPAPATPAPAPAPVVTPAAFCAEPGLALCVTFDGDTVDRSPNAIAPASSQAITFTSGKLGQAATFDASSALRYAPHNAFETGKATIEAWVKRRPGVTEDGVVFDADGRFSLTVLRDGSIQCTSSSAFTKGGSVPVDTWTHVACVFENKAIRAYVAGATQSTFFDGVIGWIGSVPNAGAAVGGNAPSGKPFVGEIDSLRVFRAGRTAAQIAEAAQP